MLKNRLIKTAKIGALQTTKHRKPYFCTRSSKTIRKFQHLAFLIFAQFDIMIVPYLYISYSKPTETTK